jgi:hypothetical protein
MKQCNNIFSLAIMMQLCAACLSAQGPDTLWTRTYGEGTSAQAVQQTHDGGFILLGTYGDTLWTRNFGGPNQECGNYVEQTSDEGFIIAGWTNSFGAGMQDFYLIKTDSNGDTLWTRTYGGAFMDYGYAVHQTPDGGYIFVGETFSFGEGTPDFSNVYLVKTDANGNALWTRYYRGNSTDQGFSVQQTHDGGYVIVGTTWSWGATNGDIYLIKTEVNGAAQWSKTYGGPGGEGGHAVLETPDHGYSIGGGTSSFGAGLSDMYLIRTDSLGDTLWTRTYGGSNTDDCYAMQQTYDNGLALTGITYSFGAGENDIYLIRTDSLGNELWTTMYGGASWDYGNAVDQTSDHGYVVAGTTNSFGYGNKMYLVRTATDPIGTTEEEIMKPNDSITVFDVFPSPFSEQLLMNVCLGQCGASKALQIYDVNGRLVKSFNLQSTISNLKSTMTWDGTDEAGKSVPQGVYFVRLQACHNNSVKKVIKLH